MDNQRWFSDTLRPILFGSRPNRAEQTKPTKHAIKNIWGDTKSYIRKDEVLRAYVKGKNYFIGPDGKKTKLDDAKIKEAVETVFGDNNRLTREAANRNIRSGHKEGITEIAGGGVLPSKIKEIRLKGKILDALKPGPRVIRKGTFSDALGAISSGAKNTVRMLAGKEPIIDKPAPIDSSVINQNTPKIK